MNAKRTNHNSARMKPESMTALKDALGVLKPWFDDPKTHEVANKCMMIASLAGILRASGKSGGEVTAAAMLQEQSELSKIPYEMLSTYADGVAALHKHASRESLMTSIGE